MASKAVLGKKVEVLVERVGEGLLSPGVVCSQ
jgi:hypothetical protein